MSTPQPQHTGLAGAPTSADIARRLRMHMGDRKMSRAKLALACGINRTSLGKKLDNEVRFELDEINAVAEALNLSWLYVAAGIGPEDPKDAQEWLDFGLKVRSSNQLSYRGAVTDSTHMRPGDPEPGNGGVVLQFHRKLESAASNVLRTDDTCRPVSMGNLTLVVNQ